MGHCVAVNAASGAVKVTPGAVNVTPGAVNVTPDAVNMTQVLNDAVAIVLVRILTDLGPEVFSSPSGYALGFIMVNSLELFFAIIPPLISVINYQNKIDLMSDDKLPALGEAEEETNWATPFEYLPGLKNRKSIN